MILVVVLLVASPIFYWLVSPASWSYARALENQRKGNLEEAKTGFLAMLRSAPEHPGALFRLGEIAFSEQDFELALDYATRAIPGSGPQQKSEVIQLQANTLLSMGRGEQAVSTVMQLRSFSSLPIDFDSLSTSELIPFMKKRFDRQFLNSLAYVMVIAERDLEKAKKYVDAVIGYFEQQQPVSFLASAYLQERSSNYLLARDSLQNAVDRVKSQPVERKELEQRITNLKNFLQSENVSTQREESLRRQLRGLEIEAGYDRLYLAIRRLQLLKEKTGDEADYASELASIRSEEVNDEKLKIEIRDSEFTEYAFELHHYYDTRAMCLLRLGQQSVRRAVGERSDLPRFVVGMELAETRFGQAFQDMEQAIELKNSIRAFQEARPENSLLISLPSDQFRSQKSLSRIDAIEDYHLMQIQIAREKLEAGAALKAKILASGFEPSPLLF